MSEFPEVLEQDDLRLRPLRERDLPDVASQIGDDRVAPWLAVVVRPFDAAQASALLAHSRHPGEDLRLIELDGTVAGGLCMGHALWYWLAPAHWGRGLMQRALNLAITARFARSAPPLIATCREDNVASRALLVRLGFAPSPGSRRVFFQSTQQAEPCRDYLMAPEQWHLLHPPVFASGGTTLRPARQNDAATLARMLPPASQTGPWPKAEDLPGFIETHRFRGPPEGLFVILDDNLRSVGMTLVRDKGTELRFLSIEDETRHHAEVAEALGAGLFSAA
ncbi:MAG: GNAT family N-acetyltransferase [Pseudomonadota bacterium]